MKSSLLSIFAHAFFCQAESLYERATGDTAFARPQASNQEHPISSQLGSSISTPLLAELERLARLVDISYCIGNTGIRKPFDCLSWCKEFPDLSLETTWSTGFLLADSCGYIALDHGQKAAGNALLRSQASEETKGAIIVAFRGTYSIANTIVDLSSVPQKYVPYPAPDDGGYGDDGPHSLPNKRRECGNCTVHVGFLQSWQLARKSVVPVVRALKDKYPSYPIQLVGHSLGGAVACLAALEFKLSLGWDDLTVTTFGEPRVGNHELARYINRAFSLNDTFHLENRPYRRVTHTNDPVPLLPLEEWGYRPHAGEIFIARPELQPSEADVRTCVGDADPECSTGTETSLLEYVRRLLHFVPLSPSIEEYVSVRTVPTRFKLWQLFFAHRDYFWRLGLCVPGGDPANWGKGWPEQVDSTDEL